MHSRWEASIILTYEDFTEGRVFDFPPYEVTAEEIKEFAQEFDPQPFLKEVGPMGLPHVVVDGGDWPVL